MSTWQAATLIEIVDLLETPRRAADDQILAAPTVPGGSRGGP